MSTKRYKPGAGSDGLKSLGAYHKGPQDPQECGLPAYCARNGDGVGSLVRQV